MIAMKLCYLALVLALVLGCAASGSAVMLALLVCMLLLPLVFLLCDLVAAGKMKVSLQLPVNLKKGQKGEIVLLLENRTAFPVCHLRCRLRVCNRLNGAEEKHTVTTFLLPKSTQQAVLTLHSRWCGRLRVEVDRIRLYDCFGLIPVPFKKTAVGAVTVQPDTFAQTILVSADANCPDDSEAYSQEHPGYDLTETFQLREYQTRDSMRQIHWKLSNKFDRLIIRDPSLPVSRSVVVFWERAAVEAHDPRVTDAQAEVVLTACRALVEQAVQFTLAWNDVDSALCVLQEIRDMDELIGVMPRLLAAKEKVTGVSGAELFAQDAGEKIFSHILYIAADSTPGPGELERLGRVTALVCGTGDDTAISFDPLHYPQQLMEIEI